MAHLEIIKVTQELLVLLSKKEMEHLEIKNLEHFKDQKEVPKKIQCVNSGQVVLDLHKTTLTHLTTEREKICRGLILQKATYTNATVNPKTLI